MNIIRSIVMFALVMTATLPTLPMIETEDLDGTFHWKRVPIPATYSAEDHAQMSFNYFFQNGTYSVPKDVEVLEVRITDGLLMVDVTESILDYGGSSFEIALVTQLKKIASEVPGIDRFTLRVEGLLQPLAYGTEIYREIL